MMYYKACDELPLYNFIKLSTGGGFKWLMTDPKYPVPADIEDIWSIILEEYSAICGDKKSAHLLSLAKEIAILEIKISITQSLVDGLSKGYSVALCEVLKEMGYYYAFSEQSLMTDLKSVVNNAKIFNFHKLEAQAEYQKTNELNQGTNTEADFYAQILQLSKFIGYKMDPKQTTVMEFAIAIDQFNKANSKQPNG